jgi:hypothetical protein
MAAQSPLSAKAVLMLGVALDGLAMIEAEPDISKVRQASCRFDRPCKNCWN